MTSPALHAVACRSNAAWHVLVNATYQLSPDDADWLGDSLWLSYLISDSTYHRRDGNTVRRGVKEVLVTLGFYTFAVPFPDVPTAVKTLRGAARDARCQR